MTKKVAIYVRVSTSEQTTENQVRELQAHCQRQGFEVFKVYADEAKTEPLALPTYLGGTPA